MATTQTTNLNLYKPEVGGEEDDWGGMLNDNMQALDDWSATVALWANDLSDLANKQTARTNLGLGTAAVYNDSRYLVGANDLSEINTAARKTSARANIGANNAANLTEGKLPDARLSSNVLLQTSTTVTLNGAFGALQLELVKQGRVVTARTVSTNGFSHTSGSPVNAATAIPSSYRPASSIYTAVAAGSSYIMNAGMLSTGIFTVSYRNYSGTLTSRSNTDGTNIVLSWLAAS